MKIVGAILAVVALPVLGFVAFNRNEQQQLAMESQLDEHLDPVCGTDLDREAGKTLDCHLALYHARKNPYVVKECGEATIATDSMAWTLCAAKHVVRVFLANPDGQKYEEQDMNAFSSFLYVHDHAWLAKNVKIAGE
jgi:hypothetical protein